MPSSPFRATPAHPRPFRRALSPLWLTALVWLCFCVTGWSAELQKLHGHQPAALARLVPSGPLDDTQELNLTVALPLRNQATLTKLLQDISDPASPNYRHYLTPAQFAAQFGPTDADYQTVSKFATAHGLTVTATHSNRVLLDVKGKVGDIQKALHVTLHTYRHPTEGRQFFAPDAEPSVDLSVPILHIGGLDNYALPHPRYKLHPALPKGNAAPNAGTGTGGGYMGNDFRTAYVPGTSLTGAGQTLGLLQFDGYSASDITYYENAAGLPNVPLQNVLLDGFSGTPTGNGGEVEVSLDIEMAISMAPGLSKIIVYEAGPGGSWHDILNRMATDNLAKQISCSWYIPGGASDPVADTIFQQMATQGQSFFSASGDYDAFSGLIPFPGDSPYITQVGGTTLTTAGAGGAWSAEQVWNWGNGQGSGGGVSTQYSIPTWQQGISMTASQGSTFWRNVPDVALTADNIYVRADGVDHNVGGTSCAAPLWAAFTALVNQRAVTNGRATVGFLNPTLYTLGKGANSATDFHDIATGNNFNAGSPTKFSGVAGYDLCTGWGSPNGAALIDALAGPPDALQVSYLPFAAAGQVGGPFNPASQTYTVTNNGSTTINWSAAKTQPWTTLSSSNDTLGPGAHTTVTWSLASAANSLAAGTYGDKLTFTNTSTAVSQSVAMSLAVGPYVDHYAFSVIPSPQVLGSPFAVSITAMDANNLPVTAFTGMVNFTASGGNTVTPAASGNFVDGQWTGYVTISGSAGSTSLTAANAFGATGQSNSFTLTTPVISTLTLASNDLIYDPGTQKIYVSVASSDNTGRANTVTPLDPATQTLGTPISIGTNPSKLAVSDDNQFLYVSQLGAKAISRISLASQSVGLQFSVGSYDAEDIQVMPGSPHTIAVSLLSGGSSNFGAAIFDDAVERANIVDGLEIATSIAFGSSPGTLYGSDGSGRVTFNRFTVSSSGLTLLDQGVWSGGNGLSPHTTPGIKTAGSLIISTDGEVVDPVSRNRVATLPVPGLIDPDVAHGRIYCLEIGSDYSHDVLHVFNSTTYAEIGSLPVTVNGYPGSLIHWPGGVAFRTNNNQIYIINAALLAPVANTADLMVTQVTTPSATIGQNFTFTFYVTNNGPSAAANVSLRDNLPSGMTYVAATTTQGSMSASGGTVTANLGTLANGASATIAITVLPSNAGAFSNLGTISSTTTDPAGGNNTALQTGNVVSASTSSTQVSVLPLTANDLAYDPIRGVLYASIPSNAGALANTLAAIDPTTAGVTAFQFVGSNPSRLVCSSDNQSLYVSLRGANNVSRFNLSNRTIELQASLAVDQTSGFLTAADIAAVPQFPHSFAVHQNTSNAVKFGVAVYDDSIQRPTTAAALRLAGSITFGSSPGVLYDYNGAFTRFNVTPYGASQVDSNYNLISDGGSTIQSDGGFIYSSHGEVVNPQTDSLVTTIPGIPLGSRGCVDTVRNRLYYLLPSSGNTATLEAFDKTTYALTDSATINGISSSVTLSSLVRCGGHRLAFLTTDGNIFIVDDEKLVPSVLAITVPQTTIEGAGTLVAAGTVSVSEPQTFDTFVTLVSSNPSKIGVPATVTIRAGQLSASFNATVVDNAILDGPKSVNISASATGFPTVAGTIEVKDNELASFSISLPANFTQGTTAQGTVTISAPAANDIVVALSSNSSLVSVPATVTILAGQTSATFTATILEAGQIVGPQSAVVTAHVDGWTDGGSSSTVVDNQNTASWPGFGNGAGHTGYQPTTLGAAPFTAGWQALGISGTYSLNPVAVAGGNVFVTYSYPACYVSSLDAATGVELWRYTYTNGPFVDPPTYEAGNLFVRRGTSSSPGNDAALWCFNPSTGSVVWTAPFDTQSVPSFGATAINGGVWMEAGYNGGLYGFNTADGSRRFTNTTIGLYDYWTPTYYNGLLYTWLGGQFQAYDLQTGAVLWADGIAPSPGSGGYSIPVIYQGRAFLVNSANFYAVDISTHAQAWSVTGSFLGSPAVANGVVYVVSSTQVNAYDTGSGALLGSYLTGDSNLSGQPIVTNDSLIVYSSTATYIFDLTTRTLRQTLPHGGTASLANNVLYLMGSDGIVRSYIQPGSPATDTAITQTISPSTATSGTNVTILLTATNNGPNVASAVVVRDTIPSGLTFVSAISSQGTCTQSNGKVTCNLGDLNDGVSATVTIVARSFGGTNVLNTATITSSTYDTISTNNSCAASVNGTPPTVVTSPTTRFASTVVLNGTINANGLSTSASFDYGPTAAYGSSVTANPSSVTGATTTSISANVTGLLPNTLYYARAKGLSNGGPAYGAQTTFTTPNNVSTLSNLALSAGTLSPSFATGTTSYSVNVLPTVTTMVLTPTTTDSNAFAYVNGTWVVNGASSNPVTLSMGRNTINITVISQDSSTQSHYTVAVTRDDTVIATQSGSQTVSTGGDATFAVSATGTGPFTYQWYYNGNPITNATAATYTISDASQGDVGNYWVVVTNTYGATTSSIYTLSLSQAVPAMPAWGYGILSALLLLVTTRALGRKGVVAN
ncbi:conserved repeat domain protein [Chthoniobacter flavus Ellin428]|uniref:Conserved repeat domain protein n=1 Tax=Chthoniobacter flavus Ellin428 TaxID=497964 RepID=B4DB66_9BACT|nr:VPAMP-CTERM sorting domain-containing protein [Chthoniobacter flavus]EDY16344.1 conserved repeat domain protein [Chthoniobacter flavus Ellin428]TCO90242.1 putative secreted protein with VPAMP-CTERM motif [Chthoniobacter flavus]